MFKDKEFNRSFPYDRLIVVMHANPKLASHAPKVSITMISIDQEILITTKSIRTKLKIIASSASKAISKCCRWKITQLIDKTTIIGVINIIQVIIA